MIRKVGKFKIGQTVSYDGQLATITEFITRSSVVLESINKCPDCWNTAKVSLRDIKLEKADENIK